MSISARPFFFQRGRQCGFGVFACGQILRFIYRTAVYGFDAGDKLVHVRKPAARTDEEPAGFIRIKIGRTVFASDIAAGEVYAVFYVPGFKRNLSFFMVLYYHKIEKISSLELSKSYDIIIKYGL